MEVDKAPNWTFIVSGEDFRVELNESTIRRINYGGTSTYVDPALVHLALAHSLEKSYRGLPGDKYEIHAYRDRVEKEQGRVRLFTGPALAPRLRSVRYLGFYLGHDEGPNRYGVAAYDDQTMSLALPNGRVLYVWTASFRQCMEPMDPTTAY